MSTMLFIGVVMMYAQRWFFFSRSSTTGASTGSVLSMFIWLFTAIALTHVIRALKTLDERIANLESPEPHVEQRELVEPASH